MPTLSPQPPPVVAWMEVLDRIEQALTESLARATVPETDSEPPGEAGHAVKLALDVLAQRQGRLQAILERAEQETGRTDAALQAAAEDLERWRQEGRAAREKPAAPASDAG
jgi:hypothetical protein